ncbi:hypothetical protein GOODEAATRI_031983 [Goodea atripinnis]|uniref:Uncharacterized protein n=1 Tax=Goodea atripinnis TaxID=208336 RepID=A0ABV0NFR7_9TELE
MSCYWSGHAHGACARALQQQLAVITDYWTWSQSGPSSEAEHDSLPSSEAFCVHINRNSGIVNKASSQTTRTGLDPMRTRLQIFGVTEHSDGILLPKLNPVRPLSGQNPPYLPLKQDGGSVSRSSPCPWRALRSPGLAGCRPDTQAREQRGRGLGAEPKRPGAARERADTPVTEQERARAVERALTVTVSSAEDERRRPRFAPARTHCGGTQAARQTAYRLTDTAHALNAATAVYWPRVSEAELDGSDPLLQ